jgi:hypothetical protein
MATTTADPATVTATSSARLIRRLAAAAATLTAALATATLAAAVAGCQSSAPAANRSGQRPALPKVPAVRLLAAQRAPSGWHFMFLPDRGAVLAFPPSMHRVQGDRGTVSAAEFGHSGSYLLYLNATPKQGQETLRDWPRFRIDHVAEEEHAAPRLLAASRGVRFLGGTGTCVIDTYVTKVKSNHYTEVACYVQGKTSSSVIIGAAPAADWATASGQLMRAVAAYRVR